MSEWLKEHAWKLIPAARADAHRNAPTHSRSRTSRNIATRRRVPLNAGLHQGLRGVCDTVLTPLSFTLAQWTCRHVLRSTELHSYPRHLSKRVPVPESSRTNADDRLSLEPLGRIEGGDGIIEGRDVADVCPQPSVTHSPNDLTQLRRIGFDNKVDRSAVGGPRLGRPDDGHQCSSRSNPACGPLSDVAADDIEHQIDLADI